MSELLGTDKKLVQPSADQIEQLWCARPVVLNCTSRSNHQSCSLGGFLLHFSTEECCLSLFCGSSSYLRKRKKNQYAFSGFQPFFPQKVFLWGGEKGGVGGRGTFLSFISHGDKSLTSFAGSIDQLHPRHQRTNRNHLSVQAPKQPETKGCSSNQQLEVLASGQVRRSEVKQVVISFSQLSEQGQGRGGVKPTTNTAGSY